jgi:hypothetical protein
MQDRQEDKESEGLEWEYTTREVTGAMVEGHVRT